MSKSSLLAIAVSSVLGTVGLALANSAAAMHVEVVGTPEPTATTHFNVYLPLRNQAALEELLGELTDEKSSNYHRWLTPAQFKERFGPSAAAFAQVRAAVEQAGLTVTAEKTQSVRVEGSVAAVERLFSAHLAQVRTPQGRTKLAAAEGHLTLPAAFATLGAVVPEFSTRPEAHTHSRQVPIASLENPLARLSGEGGFLQDDLAEAYQLPAFTTEVTPPGAAKPVQLTGAGATIGILMSSKISPKDLSLSFNSDSVLRSGATLVQAYSTHTKVPVPTVSFFEVEGGSGPFDPNTNGAAAEASIDTQTSLGTAPGAAEILYDIPNLGDDSIMAGYTDIDEYNAVDVVSSSFGECELYYAPAYNYGIDYTGILQAEHALFQQGNAQGITFLVSSGDNGAVECTTPAYLLDGAQGTSFVVGVSTPASDPAVTAVGGTNLVTSATPGVNDATYVSENAFYDPRLTEDIYYANDPVSNNTWGSGGGFSTIWSKPSYQNLVATGSATQRSLPDVSLMMGGCPGDADLKKQNCELLPRSFGLYFIEGGLYGYIGTSLSSPQFAGVLAHLIEKEGGRLGNVNPMIYSLSAKQEAAGGLNAPPAEHYFHKSIYGNNNYYAVKPGDTYSEVLGNGTLKVSTFLGLPSAPTAGTPNTSSNP
jgi:subtilase family serine protease